MPFDECRDCCHSEYCDSTEEHEELHGHDSWSVILPPCIDAEKLHAGMVKEGLIVPGKSILWEGYKRLKDPEDVQSA